MLQVRKEQSFVFEQRAYVAWSERVFDEVRRCWPHLAQTQDDALRDRLIRAARDADQLGLKTSGQWLRYANVALALGDDFALDAEAKRILGAPTPAGVRLEKLVSWAFATLRGGGR